MTQNKLPANDPVPDNTADTIESSNSNVRRLLLQQKALADFGSFALRQSDLITVLTEAAKVCAQGLNVPFCKICRYRANENDLLIEAGFGWKPGVIGHVVSRTDESTPQGRAFSTGLPSVCNDLRADTEFRLPAFYHEHGIISTIDVIIRGNGKPYGVLEIDSDQQHDYDQHDIDFLTGFANVLGEAVATAARSAVLAATLTEMKMLLAQKNTLAEELQHRVRNSLQLIYGMLTRHLEEPDGKPAIKAIARRVSTLAQVYDHLLGSDMTRTTDFGAFSQSLCLGIRESHQDSDDSITLSCDAETIVLDLDVVTALGLIIAELVTNSYEHAFPGDQGSIVVSIRCPTTPGGTGVLTVTDNGTGFADTGLGKRHGLGVIRRLVEQVHGTIALDATQGTVWTIGFPMQASVPV